MIDNDLPPGPEDFRGSDEESHYMSQTSAADLVRPACRCDGSGSYKDPYILNLRHPCPRCSPSENWNEKATREFLEGVARREHDASIDRVFVTLRTITDVLNLSWLFESYGRQKAAEALDQAAGDFNDEANKRYARLDQTSGAWMGWQDAASELLRRAEAEAWRVPK